MSCCTPPEPYGRWFPYFAGFTAFTPTIPKMYFDVDSVEQRYFTLCKQLHKLICYVDYMGDKIDIDHSEIEALKEQFQEFVEHGFDEYYAEQIAQWVNDHMGEIISQYVRQVFFGLTLEGYFVAYIPVGSAWEDVIFDTGAVYDLDTYGRLMLYYETDASSDVWQDNNVVRDFEHTVNDINRRLNRTENELYNPLTESDVND